MDKIFEGNFSEEQTNSKRFREDYKNIRRYYRLSNRAGQKFGPVTKGGMRDELY